MSPPRSILHLDMDAFFASVEVNDDPSLRGKPVIVGGSDRGVVCAASYEARTYGVHSAMPAAQARLLCPHGVFLPVRMHRYSEVSRLVFDIVRGYSPLVQKTSVDEAYIDMTGCETAGTTPVEAALALKSDIAAASGCTCSVGVAPNKFLAKIASDMNKPDGLFIIPEDEALAFLADLPVKKIPGVGPKTLETLARLDVSLVGHIAERPAEYWMERFGERGLLLHRRSLGLDESPVVPHSESKSTGCENTFSKDIARREELEKHLLLQAERVGADLRRMKRYGRTVTVKIKFNDFKVRTKAHTLPAPTQGTEEIYSAARAILAECALVKPVRLIGVTVSNLSVFGPRPSLLDLIQEADAISTGRKTDTLDATIDVVRKRFGKDALVRGKVFGFTKRDGKAKPAEGSPSEDV